MLTLSQAQQKAAQLDAQDNLAVYRPQFVISDPDLIYMDGNSLGRLPKAAQSKLAHRISYEWGERLIRSWNEGWFYLQEEVGGKIAGIIGAAPDQVIINDATSINLYKLAFAALQKQAPRHNTSIDSGTSRRKIVTDDLNFPSDHYIFQGLVGAENLIVVPSPDGITGPIAGIQAALNDNTALLSLSHTVFKSGYTYDVAAITKMAHEAGAMVLWDMSHSVGSVPAFLDDWQVDLAVGCTYKYLNGGPGAPAFMYIRRDLQEQLINPITGWLGHNKPFQFGLDYQPQTGMRRFVTGTPPLLSVAGIEAGVEMIANAGMSAIRAKSELMTEFLIELWQAWLQPLGFTLNTPREVAWRGSHVSLGHEDAAAIDRALIEKMNVIPDFRRPDSIRYGLAPLHNTFTEIVEAMARTRQVVADNLYQEYAGKMTAVT